MTTSRSALCTNVLELGILYVLFVVAVALKPAPYRRIFFPILCVIYSAVLLFPPDDPFPPVIGYVIGLAGANLLCQAFDFVFLHDPQISLRRNGEKQAITDLGVYERLIWASDLISNTRGVNWNFEAPRLRRSTKPRWTFVVSQLQWFAVFWIVADAATFHMRHNPAFRKDGGENMDAHGIVWQAWNVTVYWAHIYFFMQLNHTLGSAMSVAVGHSAPGDWPAWCGPIGDTTSVRKFWGQTWHQSLRRMLSADGKYLANVFLLLPPGSLGSAYVQLFTAFFVSGLVHGAGDFAATRNIHSVRRNILFFVLQAVAITLEDTIISLGKRCGLRRIPKVVGYFWVLIWMTWSSPIWLETLVEGGLIDFRLPYSLLNKISRGL
ncbi:hypothetical protein GALMADRAFT_271385 [Galerina marginata CBS 339.88]|uniref:Wax synthase domain-containing protein n=1 Tax=Galerina marginata (strain CBS 339.88) TaxID=685588 RepID=A0A067SLT1_GALM3|nr:hypothetical protein GALMADRAFT_271385 [Galerina marginata CBS 339.88]